ncbi:MAG: flagellar hook-length control protein FliK [Thiobacillus sp.]|nr:flagellar hook-length control protein FliK [Thiobacillus sp.]
MFPVQFLARILDVPPALDGPNRQLSGLVGVQRVLNATERDQAGPRAAFEHLKVGQTLTGLVKSLTQGVSLVEIEGQNVAMRLPQHTAPGDTLRLRFAGHMPQPVFLLDPPETAASDTPKLSQTARMLSDLMQQLPGRGTLPTLTAPGPLLDQATLNPSILALALRTTLVRSGLFYESHLANWVTGQDSLDGLLKEPQNRPSAEAPRGAPQAPANPLHTLLTQQLQVLESPQFVWRGELWPGQPLEWILRHDAGQEQDAKAATGGDETAGAGWESHLKLTLPHLGTVNVHIRLDAQQAFSIRMVPEQSDTEPVLQGNRARLAEQLAAAGCALKTLTVEHDGDA